MKFPTKSLLGAILATLLIGAGAQVASTQVASTQGITASWKDHTIYQLNSTAMPMKQQASLWIPSASWPGTAQFPYLVFMPERNRILLHVQRIKSDHDGVFLMPSDDLGKTWGQPYYMHTNSEGVSDADACVGLTYLGDGKLISASTVFWFSYDYGAIWGDRTDVPKASNGQDLQPWNVMLVDKDPATGKTVRIADTRFRDVGVYGNKGFTCQASIRFSTDEGKTWAKEIDVPEWLGINEVVCVRAKNGDIVAICRINMHGRFEQTWNDNYCGQGVSISKDNGYTWSKVKTLFDYGRMHSSPVMLPNGDIVVTYLARRGYPNTPDDNRLQFGIEAVVSHDNGQTWDLDHRYILYEWPSTVSSRDPYTAMSTGCNCTSIVLPDGSILTGAGVGPRLDPTKRDTTPRDIVLIKWRPNAGPVSKSTKIADAPYDSDLRNHLDINKFIKATPPATRKNVASAAYGAVVTSSQSAWDPSFVLHDSYVYPEAVSFDTIPAWIEVKWPKAQRIDQIDIYPGDPSGWANPSNECTPVEYRLQAMRYGQWVDIVPRVFNAIRVSDFLKTHTWADDFRYQHKFAPVTTTAVRLFITKSSDSGKRMSSPDKVITPADKRVTMIRSFEVFEAK